jgi:Rod binding domain-containing protein
MSFTSGLPPIDASQLPTDVRAASPARQSAYEAGMGFEQMLVQQLSQSLTDSSGDASSSGDSTGGSGGLGGDSPYASLLPDALTSGVMDAGGLGLARQLMDAIAPAAPTTATPAVPTTPAPATTTPTPPSEPTSGSASGGASFPA